MAKNRRFDDDDRRGRGNGRNGNVQVGKMYDEILKAEKKQNIHKLRLRAYCTHSTNPSRAHVRVKTLANGERRFVCKYCEREMKLNKIEDNELLAAIDTVLEACDYVKIMSNEHDARILDIISDIELKVSGYMYGAYKSARSAGAKRNARNNRGRRMGGSRTVYRD